MFRVLATKKIRGNGKIEIEVNNRTNIYRVRRKFDYIDFDYDDNDYAIALFSVIGDMHE